MVSTSAEALRAIFLLSHFCLLFFLYAATPQGILTLIFFFLSSRDSYFLN